MLTILSLLVIDPVSISTTVMQGILLVSLIFILLWGRSRD